MKRFPTALALAIMLLATGIAAPVSGRTEEYDPEAGRMLGNFPQAISHVALVNTACNLSHTERAMLHRSRD